MTADPLKIVTVAEILASSCEEVDYYEHIFPWYKDKQVRRIQGSCFSLEDGLPLMARVMSEDVNMKKFQNKMSQDCFRVALPTVHKISQNAFARLLAEPDNADIGLVHVYLSTKHSSGTNGWLNKFWGVGKINMIDTSSEYPRWYNVVKVDPSVYVVEKILSHRANGNKTEYLIHWKGYDETHNSWEPRQNIYDDSLLEQYHNKNNTSDSDEQIEFPMTASVFRLKFISEKQAHAKTKLEKNKIARENEDLVRQNDALRKRLRTIAEEALVI